ncbi:hypothetical protein EES37_10570 [Streptomyces sp. ADI91-18]|nr:hypothetical protein EES37_10570 [Streptomyces sp. ADI91-18]
MRTYDIEHLGLRDQYVRGRERLDGAQREQTRVAGAGTEEGDVSLGGDDRKGGGGRT